MKIDIDGLTEAELIDLSSRIVERLKFLNQMRALKKKRVPGLNRGTIWVREDFDELLPDKFWLGQALTNYAIQHAGTDADLDSDLEAAATDHVLQQNSEQ